MNVLKKAWPCTLVECKCTLAKRGVDAKALISPFGVLFLAAVFWMVLGCWFSFVHFFCCLVKCLSSFFELFAFSSFVYLFLVALLCFLARFLMCFFCVV